MHLFLAALTTLFVTGQAFLPDRNGASIYERSAYRGGELVRALEKFKDVMRSGNSSFGVLDPLQKEHLDIDLARKGLFAVKGTLDNVHASGLSNYKVNKGDFALAGLKVNVSLTWDQIMIMTNYNVQGTLLDDMSFYGNGSVALAIKGLVVTVDLKMSVRDKKLFVSFLELHAHLKELDCKIIGLFDDEDMSKLISRVISNIAPGLLEDYQVQLSTYASPVVANLMNNILKDYTLKDLLDMIKG